MVSAKSSIESEKALSLLAEASDISKGDVSNLQSIEALKNRLVGVLKNLEDLPSYSLHERVETTRASLTEVENSLGSACSAALADFYISAAQSLLNGRVDRLRLSVLGHPVERTVRVPSLYDAVMHRIQQSGVQAELADMESPLNIAGQQLVALLLEREQWPVLVTSEDAAPILGQPAELEELGQGGDHTESKIVPSAILNRMREEEHRLANAGGITELREPAATMVGIMDSLAAWLPFRTNQKEGPTNDNGGSNAGGEGGSTAAGSASGFSGSLSAMATSTRSPNFQVTTTDPDCSVAYTPALFAYYTHFGGPKTPVSRYLANGYYFFEATAKDGSIYTTKYKVKVPDSDPLNLPFP